MVIYTVSYPPRLVPVSLVLPGLDDQKVGSVNATSAKTATASESFSSPATAPPAKNASAASFAAGAGSNVSANGRHRLQRRLLLSPAAEAALGDDFAADATEVLKRIRDFGWDLLASQLESSRNLYGILPKQTQLIQLMTLECSCLGILCKLYRLS